MLNFYFMAFRLSQ
ncbi:hypothetical protein BpHYR1_003409 [Brachionus plicatilis]|uniref:Uncharacterized protein n=1 Tax=Brachionus plicatilis TaxID=10195 RepID=A0A3M7PTU4_BRAPC|nr:hypothetical protein BpHYR1_003409 [Brachionus plicatilis]